MEPNTEKMTCDNRLLRLVGPLSHEDQPRAYMEWACASLHMPVPEWCLSYSAPGDPRTRHRMWLRLLRPLQLEAYEDLLFGPEMDPRPHAAQTTPPLLVGCTGRLPWESMGGPPQRLAGLRPP